MVWTDLNALRAHDDRFEAEINKIDLNNTGSGKIIVDVIGQGGTRSVASGNDTVGSALRADRAGTLTQDEFDLRAKIYAKMVKKVGTRRYWSLWAEEVAKIADTYAKRTQSTNKNALYDSYIKAFRWAIDRLESGKGIVNDPNKWLEESSDERYIVDLIIKVVTVSMETQKIVAKLPLLEFEKYTIPTHKSTVDLCVGIGESVAVEIYHANNLIVRTCRDNTRT